MIKLFVDGSEVTAVLAVCKDQSEVHALLGLFSVFCSKCNNTNNVLESQKEITYSWRY